MGKLPLSWCCSASSSPKEPGVKKLQDWGGLCFFTNRGWPGIISLLGQLFMSAQLGGNLQKWDTFCLALGCLRIFHPSWGLVGSCLRSGTPPGQPRGCVHKRCWARALSPCALGWESSAVAAVSKPHAHQDTSQHAQGQEIAISLPSLNCGKISIYYFCLVVIQFYLVNIDGY